MMEGTAPAFSPQITNYLNAWAASCAQAVGTAVGAPISFDISLTMPPESPPESETDIWLTVALSGALSGSMSLRLNHAEARALAQAFMGEAPSQDSKPEYAEAIQELFRQIAGHVATALTPVCGEIHLQVEGASAPAAPGAITAWIQTSTGVKLVIEARLSSELVTALTSTKPELVPAAAPVMPETYPEPAPQPGTAAGFSSPAGDPGSPQAPKNLDLVMDVELGVVLRFGTRQLLLKDILELTSGSVIELDQQVQDPVELLLDGRPIARGEIVVIDGNYGLRVMEVIRSEPASA